MPCKVKEHEWEFVPKGYYSCTICGALGWSKSAVLFGAANVTVQPRVIPYKCPICKGPTSRAKDVCLNCEREDMIQKQVTYRSLTKWKDLTPSQQKMLTFLASQQNPAFVSHRNGSGSGSSLSLRGLVAKAGESSGQIKWVLTKEGRRVYQQGQMTVS